MIELKNEQKLMLLMSSGSDILRNWGSQLNIRKVTYLNKENEYP